MSFFEDVKSGIDSAKDYALNALYGEPHTATTAYEGEETEVDVEYGSSGVDVEVSPPGLEAESRNLNDPGFSDVFDDDEMLEPPE